MITVYSSPSVVKKECTPLKIQTDTTDVVSPLSIECEIYMYEPSETSTPPTRNRMATAIGSSEKQQANRSLSRSTQTQHNGSTHLNKKVEEQAKQITSLLEKLRSMKQTLQHFETSDLSKQIDSFPTENATLKKKVSDLNAKCLVLEELEEEKQSLQNTNIQLKTEKKKLEQKTDTNRHEISTMNTVLSNIQDHMMTLTAEVNQIKENLPYTAKSSDLEEIKSEIKKVVDLQSIAQQATATPSTNESASNKQEQCHNNIGLVCQEMQPKHPVASACISNKIQIQQKRETTQSGNATKEDDKQATKKHILILGDSVTKMLKTEKMKTDEINAQIRTTPGAKLKTIETVINRLLQSNTVQISDAVILHVVIINVSDGQDKTTIQSDFKSLTELIKSKILISSILPMKTVKLMAPLVDEINKEVKNYCFQEGYTFIDSTPNFLNAKHSYQDKVHLNMKGTATFGSHLKKCVSGSLNITYNTNSNSWHDHNNRRPNSQRRKPNRRSPWAYSRYHHQSWGHPMW